MAKASSHHELMGDNRIVLGQEAEHLLSRLRPHLQAQREAAIRTLIMHHRANDLTEGLMRSQIAKLDALDTLENDLKQRIGLGQKDLEESRRS
jgi:hypothetical protein